MRNSIRVFAAAVSVAFISVLAVPVGSAAAADEYEVLLGQPFTYELCWQGLSRKSVVTLEEKQGKRWVPVSKVNATKTGAAAGCAKKFPWVSVNTYLPSRAGVIQLRVSAGAQRYPVRLIVTAEKPLNAFVGDLAAFTGAHGAPVVSVVCAGVTVSGVVLAVTASPEAANAGMKSGIATSRYGLQSCLSGDFLDRRVTVRAGAVEHIGYVWSWDDQSDIAVVYTPATLQSIPSFQGNAAPRPSTGDTAVLVWGQAGAVGRANEGTVALSESDFIFTTNRGSGTHLAGAAVFNSRGELIGIVDASSLESDARTIAVLPITRLCGNFYSTACYIAWGS
jgi:hypothetical protein